MIGFLAACGGVALSGGTQIEKRLDIVRVNRRSGRESVNRYADSVCMAFAENRDFDFVSKGINAFSSESGILCFAAG